MPALERRLGLRGPRFWMDDGVLLFCNHLDASTRDGPREATAEDKAAHPEALALAASDADGLGAPMVQFKTPKRRA